jgi:hypothetical protein
MVRKVAMMLHCVAFEDQPQELSFMMHGPFVPEIFCDVCIEKGDGHCQKFQPGNIVNLADGITHDQDTDGACK